MNLSVLGRAIDAMCDSPRDPRPLQILCLATLTIYGALALDLEIDARFAALTIAVALTTQVICTLVVELPSFDPRSALISALSLCLLLRTGSPAVCLAAAVVAIASKFLLRVQGRHVFNPSALALVVVLIAPVDAWISPGQWGSGALGLFAVACLGLVVLHRSDRSDVTFAFLASYGGLLLARSLWLGEPMSIVAHRLSNGGLLLFAFFMISDPRTTPGSRVGRVLFAVLVALGATVLQFGFFRTNPLLWSLVALSPVTVFIDRWFPQPGESHVVTDSPPLSRLRRRMPVVAPIPRIGLLRFLRGEGRHPSLQSRLAGGDRSRGRSQRRHHGQRLQG